MATWQSSKINGPSRKKGYNLWLLSLICFITCQSKETCPRTLSRPQWHPASWTGWPPSSCSRCWVGRPSDQSEPFCVLGCRESVSSDWMEYNLDLVFGSYHCLGSRLEHCYHECYTPGLQELCADEPTRELVHDHTQCCHHQQYSW